MGFRKACCLIQNHVPAHIAFGVKEDGFYLNTTERDAMCIVFGELNTGKKFNFDTMRWSESA